MENGRDAFSGSTCVSFKTRKRTGSMPSFSAIEVAERAFGRRSERAALGRDGRFLCGAEVEGALCWQIVHLHQRSRRARLIEGFGHDKRDRLVIVIHVRPGKRPVDIELA